MQKQIAVNAKLQAGKRDQTRGLTGRIPSRRRMSALDSTATEEEEEVHDDNDDDGDPCTLINYMRTFCAPSPPFLSSFNLTRIPSASNFEHNVHPQSFPLLLMKDVSAFLCRYLVTPRSKSTQDPRYYVHNIIKRVVQQLLPDQLDYSIHFS